MRCFKADKKRLILFAIFISISSATERYLAIDGPPYFGFPIAFYNPSGNYGPLGKFVQEQFYLTHFLLDVLIWYIVSCLVIWVYNLILKKREFNRQMQERMSLDSII